ncbi:MAG: Maf family protein [Gammaproteobacteria bacterium]
MNRQVYLASSSPRRAELLTQIGVGFETIDVNVDERRISHEAPEEYVSRLALSKADAGCQMVSDYTAFPVVGADTAVVINGEILGKASNREHGIEMLKKLSGHTHWVYTGVAVVGKSETTRLSVSEVTFREIMFEELQSYWLTGEPMGKAGGYAIQGMGAMFVSKLTGSYSGVMGLPVFETAEMLKEHNVCLLSHSSDNDAAELVR